MKWRLLIYQNISPAGQRLLNFDATKLSNDILKVLVANKFTLEEMELVLLWLDTDLLES